MKLSALVAIAAVIGGSFLIPMPAEAESEVYTECLKATDYKDCADEFNEGINTSRLNSSRNPMEVYNQWFDKAQSVLASEGRNTASECPSGQAMATLKNRNMGCMTPGQYELWKAQMTAAHRANRRTWVMPNNNTYAIQNLQQQLHQQQLNNSHQQWRTRNGYGY